MNKILILLLVGLVSACAHKPYPVTSPYFHIPAGSQLILKQELIILPNSGRVYIQYGKTVSEKEVDQYYANCRFVSWEISKDKTVIKPDKFLVINSKKFEEVVKHDKPLQFASARGSRLTGSYGSITAIEYSSILTIQSELQPNIRQFICSHWEDPVDDDHLTVAQINKVLGDIAELKVP